MNALMQTLTVWSFEGPGTADAAVERIRMLAGRGAVTVDDAAEVRWPAGIRKPATRSLGSITGRGELWGGSWGVVLALVFLVPIAGPVFGAAAGAVAAGLADFGVDDRFIRRVRDAVTPGRSALFLLADGAVADRLQVEMGDLDPTLIRTDLTSAQELRLHEVLGEEAEPT